MKIQQEDAILIKNLYLCQSSTVHEGCWVNCPTYSWKLGSIDRVLMRIRKMSTIVRQRGSGKPHSLRSSGGPSAQSMLYSVLSTIFYSCQLAF